MLYYFSFLLMQCFRVFLKEKAGWFTYVSMMFMLVGIVFVIKPPFIFGIEEGNNVATL